MICGLLGEHLGHSYSPQIHALLGAYSYDLFEVSPENLEEFLLHGKFDGLNVTIPYKKAVIPYCAALSETAKAMGSVNTIVRRPDGSLYGDNTDFHGFSWLLSRNDPIQKGEKALVLGTGGASVTVQAVLRRMGAEVAVLSRRGENNYGTLERHADAVLVVNATPVGMYPRNGERLIDLDRLPNLRCVLDLIYNPARTALLLDSEARGVPCENGLSMLVAQAKRAAELFTNSAIPDSRCEEILEKLEKQMQNLILIGMPGCGKSTVGKLVADRLRRPFIDTDEAVCQAVGCDIPTFFAKNGEEAFRKVETSVLADLCKKSGQVIATGGGCVTRPENYPLLHQNGQIVWIQREIASLPVDGRPVSAKIPPERLYRLRKPLYEAYADRVAVNDQAPEAAAAQVLALAGLDSD